MWDFELTTMPQNDLTLYAQWEIVDYTVTYDTNGANTVTPNSEVLNYGDYVTEPTDPAKTGYEFNGWNMMRDGLGVFWNFMTMTMPDNDVELYADWNVTTPTIDPINPGDACISGSDGVPGGTIEITDIYGNIIGTAIVNPDGTWEICSDVITDPDDIFVNQVDPDGNTSESVEVVKPSSFFTMFFNTNGANSETPASQSVKIGNRPTQPENPVKTGYTFMGWFTSTGDQWIFGVDAMGASDVTLNAYWSINEPVINPINPGDTCITGVGAPGSTAIIYDEFGNVIGTVVIGVDGTFTYCDDSFGTEGNISIELIDPEGNVSDRVIIKKPGNGIVDVLPETGVNTLETLLFGLLIMIIGFVFIKKSKKICS
jgi:uncharacterized repeat protein (TIGR02543 family)/LPXTG-motif cell wall-anchored protein